MKKFGQLSELNKMLFLAIIVSLILIGLSCIGLFYSQPGWLIGVSSGSIIEIINIVLVYKGSGQILKEQKPALFLLYYFLRTFLIIGLITALILLQYKAKLSCFDYSFWGALIGYTPMQIVIIVATLLHKGDRING